MNALYEAKIILPLAEGLGTDKAKVNQDIWRGFIENFGGVTVTNGYGAWVDDKGQTVQESVSILTVAMENSQRNREYLIGVAAQVKRHLGEDAVYVKFPSGQVEIV